MNSLTACDVPKTWTEGDLRRIASEEARRAVPPGLADATLVEDGINNLKAENDFLQSELLRQDSEINRLGLEIDSLRNHTHFD